MAQRTVPLTYQGFREQIDTGTRTFRGGVIVSIFLRDVVIEGPGSLDRGLDLRRVKVKETVDLEGVTIRGDLNLDEVVIKGGLDLGGVIIEGNLFLRNARIGSGIDLIMATVKGKLMLDGARVKGFLALGGAVIEGPLYFTGARVRSLDLVTKQGPTCIYVSTWQAQLVHWAAPGIPLVVLKYP